MNDFSTEELHWGEAAFYLSLDIAAPLVAMIADSDSDDGMRDGVRAAILSFRDMQKRNRGYVQLHALVSANCGGNPAFERVLRFAATGLSTFARPVPPIQNQVALVFASDEVNERASHFADHEFGISNLRSHLATMLDADRYATFAALVFGVDRSLSSDNLSSWDREILARNAALYPPSDPFGNLVSSFDIGEKALATAAFEQEIGSEAFATLGGLCRQAHLKGEAA